MQIKNDDNTADNTQKVISSNYRRKRINRMKTAIVIVVIIFLILPTICCIILGIQVSRMQKQVNDLVKLHGPYGLSYDDTSGEHYAYAAEKSTEGIIKEDANLHLVDGVVNPHIDITDTGAEINSEQSDKASGTVNGKDNSSGLIENKEDTTDATTGKYAGKKVYLTFDDGPSIYTDDILDILADYNVKATFFIIGKTDYNSKRLYQRIVNEGHSLGMHSYSHVYKKIYNSVEDFDKDFTKLWKLLYDTTGYKPSIFRFPGGSDNLVNENGMEDFIRYLNKASIVYFDWNVLNGDATGVKYTKKQLIRNVLAGVELKDTSIVLMHDSQTKETTVESLPGILDKLISGGAEILPLDKNVPPIQMIKADSIK